MKISKGLVAVLAFCLLFLTASNIFAQVDVARRTTAITYPLDESVVVQFRGTTRFPRMKGTANIKRTSRNGTEISLSVSKMPRPFELGRGYATYVLWAVSPEGQIDNLGEIKRRGFFEFDSKISVTTRLQTFSLIITAEPHFLVRRPSQEIMLENLSPYAKSGKTIATINSVQYFGNSSDYFRDARTPEIAEMDYSKTPSAILQAKQAIALARYAGAERDASAELQEAVVLLQNAENAQEAGRDEESVDISARRAISAAVKAESTAMIRKEARERRNEQTKTDAEMRRAEDRYAEAQDRIKELENLLSEETRAKQLSERDGENYLGQLRELRQENGRLREQVGKLQVENDSVKTRLAYFEQERKTEEDERIRTEKMTAIAANEGGFIQSLKKFGSVTKDQRGIVLTLPETWWASTRSADFSAGTGAKLTSLGDLLANNPDYSVRIESHTDNNGVAEELNDLTDRRSKNISSQFAGVGVSASRLDARGMGSGLPIAPNTTNANRAKNRRVQLILSVDL